MRLPLFGALADPNEKVDTDERTADPNGQKARLFASASWSCYEGTYNTGVAQLQRADPN